MRAPFLLGILVAASGCLGVPDSSGPGDVASQSEGAAWMKGLNSHVAWDSDNPFYTERIDSQAELDAFWPRHTMSPIRAPPPEAPSYPFDGRALLFIVTARPGTGDTLDASFDASGGRLVVEAWVTRACITLSMPSTPYVFLEVPATEDPVPPELRHRVQYRFCEGTGVAVELATGHTDQDGGPYAQTITDGDAFAAAWAQVSTEPPPPVDWSTGFVVEVRGGLQDHLAPPDRVTGWFTHMQGTLGVTIVHRLVVLDGPACEVPPSPGSAYAFYALSREVLPPDETVPWSHQPVHARC